MNCRIDIFALALAGLAITSVSAMGQQPLPDSPQAGDADVRRLDEPPPLRRGPDSPGGPGGTRRPGDVRGRGGPMPPFGDPPGGPGPDGPGRGPGRRPMGPDIRGGMRGGPRGPGIGPGPNEMQRLEQDDPEMHKLVAEDNRLDREAAATARRLLQAKSPEREKLEADLAVLVNKHFDVRQQRRELALARMEEELKRLREAIEERSKGRDTIVAKRIAELVGSDDRLEF